MLPACEACDFTVVVCSPRKFVRRPTFLAFYPRPTVLVLPSKSRVGTFFFTSTLSIREIVAVNLYSQKKKNHDTRALRTPKNLLQVANAKVTESNSTPQAFLHRIKRIISLVTVAPQGGGAGAAVVLSSQRSASAFHVALRVHGVA